MGKSKVASEDSLKALLKYADPEKKVKDLSGKDSTVFLSGYEKTQPVKILDYSVDESVGDAKMSLAKGGDFCRKCGMKMCRCVDYTQWGSSDPNKRRKV